MLLKAPRPRMPIWLTICGTPLAVAVAPERSHTAHAALCCGTWVTPAPVPLQPFWGMVPLAKLSMTMMGRFDE